MKFTDEELARQRTANRIHELEQRVEELEAENQCERGFTETKPTEPGWYWFLPNDKSPMLGSTATVRMVERCTVRVSEPQGGLCVRFPHGVFIVSEIGGLWSEKLEEPR